MIGHDAVHGDAGGGWGGGKTGVSAVAVDGKTQSPALAVAGVGAPDLKSGGSVVVVHLDGNSGAGRIGKDPGAVVGTVVGVVGHAAPNVAAWHVAAADIKAVLADS